MKTLGIVAVALALAGCGTKTSSMEIRTPDRNETRTHNEGAYSSDDRVVVDTTGGYEECKAEYQQYLPKDSKDPQYANWLMWIEQMCHGRAGGAGSYGAGYGPGMAMVPGTLPVPGYPVRIVGLGEASLDRYPGALAAVRTSTSSSVPAPSAKADAGTNDNLRIVRELARQHKLLCESRQKQGLSCDGK